MQEGREKWAPQENVCGSTMVDSASFYQRLGGFLESSGLTLLFDAQETTLDLYLIYKEVTKGGGFHQVTRDKRWAEVASAVNLECTDLNLVSQLEKLYQFLLIQFENMFSYQNPENPTNRSGDSSGIKRKYQGSFTLTSIDIEDASTGQVKCIDNSFSVSKGCRSVGQKKSLAMPVEAKLMNKKPKLPLEWRNPYQLFVKKECARLKSIHGSSVNGKNARDAAVDAWRYLSTKDREVYIELSRQDKQRFWQETRVYTNNQNSGCTITSGDYHVNSQPDPESLYAPDQSMVDLAMDIMKAAPTELEETISDVNWHDFYG